MFNLAIHDEATGVSFSRKVGSAPFAIETVQGVLLGRFFNAPSTTVGIVMLGRFFVLKESGYKSLLGSSRKEWIQITQMVMFFPKGFLSRQRAGT